MSRFAIALAAIVLFAPRSALANGRFPASNELVFSPSDSTRVVLRTTFGVLISSNGGLTWSWICEDVLGIPSTSREDPSLALTAGGNLVAGSSAGLLVSADTGCGWAPGRGDLRGQFVRDLALVPRSPHSLVALTSTASQDAGPDGAAGYVEQVYQSADDGADWAALGSPLDPTAVATTLDVAASDPSRLYVSAARSAAATASLFVSTDSGATWVERPIPIDPGTESNAYIAAVDPTNADRVYVRTAGSTSRLLVTSDAGLTYQAPLSLGGQMLGFALSPDGSTVYAGNLEQGLFVGDRDSLAFRNVSTTPIQCLAVHGSDLWACSEEQTAGFIAGVSSDGGATFGPRVHLLAQPLLGCAADASVATQCAGAPRDSLCQQLPGCPEDAGAPAPDAGARGAARPHGCGCSAAPRGGAPTGFALALAWTAIWRRRTRGPRRRNS